MFHVYVLRSLRDRSLYIGLTNDLERRLGEHDEGESPSTKAKRPLELLLAESFLTRREARDRERFYKSGFGREILKTTFGVDGMA